MSAFDFNNTSGRYVEAAGSSSINNFTALTFWLWFYADAFQSGDRWWSKFGQELINNFGDADDFYLSIDRATTLAEAASNENFATGKWWFLAGTYDESDGPRLFKGDLDTAVAECAYTTRNVGAGATNSSTGVLRVGTGYNFTTGQPDARVALFGLRNDRLTLTQIRRLQYAPLMAESATKLLWWLGYNGLTNVPDLSGNLNTGTVAGSVALANGVPIELIPLFTRPNYAAVEAAPAGGHPAMRRLGLFDYMRPVEIGRQNVRIF